MKGVFAAFVAFSFCYGTLGKRDESWYGNSAEFETSEFGIEAGLVDRYPQVRFWNYNDKKHGDVYCLTFKETFETNNYAAGATARAGEVDFMDMNWTYLSPGPMDTDFAFSSEHDKFTSVEFAFVAVTDSEGEPALKFTIEFDAYTWEPKVNQSFVLVLEPTECSDEFSGSFKGDKGDSESEESEEGVDSAVRRHDGRNPQRAQGLDFLRSLGQMQRNSKIALNRLVNGKEAHKARTLLQAEPAKKKKKKGSSGKKKKKKKKNSSSYSSGGGGNKKKKKKKKKNKENGSKYNSKGGISSDEPRAFDLGSSYFVISETACGEFDPPGCDPQSVNVELFYEDASNELHMVFSYFGNYLFQDPSMGEDKNKRNASGMARFSLLALLVAHLLAAL